MPTVLVVDDDLARRLSGHTLDVKETADRMKLSLAHPDRDTVEP